MLRIALVLVIIQAAVAPNPLRAQAPADEMDFSALDSLLSLPVASAAKYNQRRADVAASVSVITSAEIAAYGFRTLTDVFQTLPGFYVSDDLNYSYVGVRGFSRPSDYNNRILVLMDGHVMNEPFYGSASVGTTLGLDLTMLDRIEVVRGPGSTLYGGSAMFAVINLITKTGKQIDGFSVAGGTGSNGTREGELQFGQQFAGGLEVMASANWSHVRGSDRYFSEFDDQATNFGIAEGLDWDRWYGGRTVLSYGDFRLDLSGSSRDKGIPTAPWETEFNNPDQRTRDVQLFGEASFALELAEDKHMTLRGFFDRYEDEGIYPYDSNWIEESASTSLGSEVRVLWDFSSSHRMVAGVEGEVHPTVRFSSRDADDEYFGGDFQFEQASVYVQDEIQFGRTGITMGARYDTYSFGESAISPRAALLFRANPSTTFKLLYGEAFRPPSVWEREYNEDAWVVINPTLGPETITTVEGVWEQRLGRSLQTRASIFRYSITGLIDLIEAPTDPLVQQYNNTSRANARGVELELTGALSGGMTGYGSYTFQSSIDESLDTELSNSPTHAAKLGLSAPLPYVTVGSNLVYETGRMTVQDTKTDSYLLVDLTLSSRAFLGRLKASGAVRNVLDTAYRTPGGWEHTQDAIPQHGRRLYFELRFLP